MYLFQSFRIYFGLFLLVCVFSGGCAFHRETAPSVQLFVAVDGNDGNTGTKQQPLASLEAARDRIRTLRQSGNIAGPVTVWLRAGTYYRTRPFKLAEQDSGTCKAPVTYRSYKKEPVHLIGGNRIPPEWCKPVNDPNSLSRIPEMVRGNVLTVKLSDHGINNYGEFSMGGPMFELFCAGKRLPVARWPNKGWTHIGQIVREGPSGSELVDENPQGKAFLYLDDRPERWRQAPDIALHGFWFYGWMEEYCKISDIDTQKKLITLDHVPGGGIKRDQWFYALNCLEELDVPGEWYLDRTQGVLYVIPPPEFPEHPLLYSMLEEPLLVLENTSHVMVRGITLEVTRGTGIVIGGGKENCVAGCIIRCIGTDAVVIDHGNKNGVLGCNLHNIGCTALRITGGNRSTLEPGENYAVNNHIHHYAQRRKVYQPAVRLYGVGHHIAHNLIHDAPHQAIAYDGNDHLIEYNEIHDVVLDSADAGVMYTGCNWTFRGNMVRYNFIHHIPHGPGLGTVGIYLDDCASSTTIFGNIFYSMLNPTFIGGGRDNAIENNIFIECETPVYMDNRGLRWEHFRPGGPMYDQLKEVRHDQPPWSIRYPELARILQEIPQAPLGNKVVRNVSYKSTWRDPETYCRQTSSKNIGRPYLQVYDNFVTDEDPGFADAANIDFRLKKDSMVYSQIQDFQPIPVEKIGPYKDAFRATWPLERDKRSSASNTHLEK
ncbi:MAG TPA: right-handed parallel beta-helix repeat-containing protein [Candidatus Hydrogenedentes bacterium]|nr:right-handed parallel beta-helix repeat-containing protein [Candidatus Hydrogenedentota bacterium]